MKNAKLRIGILLDSYNVSAWEHKMFERIISSNCTDVCIIILNDKKEEPKNNTIFSKIIKNYNRLPYLIVRKFLEILYFRLIERHTYLPNADSVQNCEKILSGIPTIKVKTVKKKYSDYFNDEDIDKIASHNVDILIRCGFGILRGQILTLPKYGIWSFHHGDNRINRGGPAGYWESMESWPETGSILQILTEDLDNGRVLYRSFSCTDRMSVTDNRSTYFWKSLSFMSRKIEELYKVGEDEFFKRVEYENRHPVFYSERLYVSPTNYELTVLTLKKILEKTRLLLEKKIYIHQWILMFDLRNGFSSSLWRYKKIIPPKDRFWADPHIVEKDNKYYVFIEEFIYQEEKGHISLIEMDKNGNYCKPEVVLSRPYHLSYPFVFEYENEFFMVPESMTNNTVELYKCIEFPNKWEFQMNLMENVRAVDATLFFHNNKWWMFVNMVENFGASSWDELFLYYSNDLFTQSWQAHPQNPIVSDCKSSRPAGKIFSHNGRFYRPSQNCSKHYGYGFNLSEITVLNEDSYSENIITMVIPNWDRNIKGTHSFARENSLHMIDALYKRRR